MMEQNEEERYVLTNRLPPPRDHQAAHKLVNSHLRRAAKIAGSYRGYSPGC
jgi:DNA-directed RNA polymerase sigma subunit (sigma70/sigma32)